MLKKHGKWNPIISACLDFRSRSRNRAVIIKCNKFRAIRLVVKLQNWEQSSEPACQQIKGNGDDREVATIKQFVDFQALHNNNSENKCRPHRILYAFHKRHSLYLSAFSLSDSSSTMGKIMGLFHLFSGNSEIHTHKSPHSLTLHTYTNIYTSTLWTDDA